MMKDTGKLLPAHMVNGRTGVVVGTLMVVCAIRLIANKKTKVKRIDIFLPCILEFRGGIPGLFNVIVLIIEKV